MKHLLMGVNYLFLENKPATTVDIYDLVESQVELEDNTFQLFTEPEELTLLNIDSNSRFEFALAPEDDSPYTVWINVGKTVSVEGRVVKSFPELFGDITGLKDFFNFLIVFVIGGLQTKLYSFDQLKTFFKFSNTEAR